MSIYCSHCRQSDLDELVLLILSEFRQLWSTILIFVFRIAEIKLVQILVINAMEDAYLRFDIVNLLKTWYGPEV